MGDVKVLVATLSLMAFSTLSYSCENLFQGVYECEENFQACNSYIEELLSDEDADQNDPFFQTLKAYSYLAIATPNFDSALTWYRKAAESNYGPAQYCLAEMYGNGAGVEQNDRVALQWYLLATEGEFSTSSFFDVSLHDFAEVAWESQMKGVAQYRIGKAFETGGNGFEQSYSSAVRSYAMSAQYGNGEARRSIGSYFELGKGLPLDPLNAYKWYYLAVRVSDNPDALADRNRFSMQLTNQQIRQAEEEAELCASSNFFDCPPISELLLR